MAHFAADVSALDDPTRALTNLDDAVFEDARNAALMLSAAEAGILCQAAAQLNWHASHRFCSTCGHRSEIRRGGQLRQCTRCSKQHFPRTDPVVITVVTHGDQCLLGQSRGRMTRLKTYSALAGFVDQGESIEEAVAREIMEEAGIQVKDVRYLFSQPWPFPPHADDRLRGHRRNHRDNPRRGGDGGRAMVRTAGGKAGVGRAQPAANPPRPHRHSPPSYKAMGHNLNPAIRSSQRTALPNEIYRRDSLTPYITRRP